MTTVVYDCKVNAVGKLGKNLVNVVVQPNAVEQNPRLVHAVRFIPVNVRHPRSVTGKMNPQHVARLCVRQHLADFLRHPRKFRFSVCQGCHLVEPCVLKKRRPAPRILNATGKRRCQVIVDSDGQSNLHSANVLPKLAGRGKLFFVNGYLFWHVRNGETVNLLHLASSPLSRFPQKCVLARFPSQPYPRPVFPAKTRPARLLSPAMVAPRLSPCFFGFQSQPIFNPSDRPTLCRICIIHLYSFSNITDGQGLCLSCMFVLSVMYGYTTLQGAYRVAKAPHRVPMGCLELVITGRVGWGLRFRCG